VAAQFSRRACRDAAATHVQRQHPTALRVGQCDQPLILPGRDQMLLGLAGHGPILPCAVRAGRRCWSRPRRAVHSPYLTVGGGRQRQRLNEQAPHRGHVQRAIRERVTRAWPLTAEVRAQTMPYQRRRSGGRQYGVYQFKQAILAKAQVVVQLLAEVAERCQSLRFRHTPSLTHFPLYRKSPRQSGPSFVQTQDPERSEGSPSQTEILLLSVARDLPQDEAISRSLAALGMTRNSRRIYADLPYG